MLATCMRHDLDIRCMIETQFHGMCCVVPLVPKPAAQVSRKRHVDEEAHVSARLRELDRLVLGEECCVAQRLIELTRSRYGWALRIRPRGSPAARSPSSTANGS